MALPQGKGRGTKRLDSGYENVKAWTSRGDVFKKKYLLIPINGGCVTSRTTMSYDGTG